MGERLDAHPGQERHGVEGRRGAEAHAIAFAAKLQRALAGPASFRPSAAHEATVALGRGAGALIGDPAFQHIAFIEREMEHGGRIGAEPVAGFPPGGETLETKDGVAMGQLLLGEEARTSRGDGLQRTAFETHGLPRSERTRGKLRGSDLDLAGEDMHLGRCLAVVGKAEVGPVVHDLQVRGADGEAAGLRRDVGIEPARAEVGFPDGDQLELGGALEHHVGPAEKFQLHGAGFQTQRAGLQDGAGSEAGAIDPLGSDGTGEEGDAGGFGLHGGNVGGGGLRGGRTVCPPNRGEGHGGGGGERREPGPMGACGGWRGGAKGKELFRGAGVAQSGPVGEAGLDVAVEEPQAAGLGAGGERLLQPVVIFGRDGAVVERGEERAQFVFGKVCLHRAASCPTRSVTQSASVRRMIFSLL